MDARVSSVLDTGPNQVVGVAYAPDGRTFATSGDDGTVRMWPAGPDGLPQGPPTVLTGHDDEVWSPQFSPDGRFLAACGVDGHPARGQQARPCRLVPRASTAVRLAG